MHKGGWEIAQPSLLPDLTPGPGEFGHIPERGQLRPRGRLTLDSSCMTHGNDATVPALPHPSRRSATELIHLHSMTYDCPSARTVSPLLSDDKGNIRLF